MIKKRKFPKIFPGWWLVFTGGILGLWGHAHYTYAISALLKPISTELGFSRAAASVPTSIGRFEGGIEAPITGWISDRFGPRWIILAGVFLMGLALILMYFINSLWAFYIVWGVILGTGMNFATGVPLRAAISNWFVKKRGTAQGIQMTMSGLSGVVVLPIIAWEIIALGWRKTLLIGGIGMLLVLLPLAWFFVKQRRPEYYGLLPDGAKVDKEAATDKSMVERGKKYAAEVGEVEFTLKQAMRTPNYWMLIAVQGAQSLGMGALNLHTIPFLTDRGIDPLIAAAMLSLRVLAGLPMRFFGGVFADHVSKNRMRFIMSGGYLLQAVGITLFLLNPTLVMIYVWFILQGLGQGVGTAIVNPLKARYFGRKAYGSILGLAQGILAPVAIVAPIYFGWTYDTTGSYINAFILVTITLAVSGVLAAFILPPKPPAEVTDVGKII